MRGWSSRWMALAVVLLCAWPAYAHDPVKDAAGACSRSSLANSASVGQFVFRTYKNDTSGETCVQVLSKGRVVFRRTNDNGGGYKLGQKADPDSGAKAIVNGTDLTGRGHPDMTVSAWGGGAHCCLVQYVFELEPVFRLLATIDAKDDDYSHFADLDGKAQYYYLTTDWTFAYWPGSFAGSPTAPVVLKYESDAGGGGYHLALNKMKANAPTAAEWEERLRAARKTFPEEASEVYQSGPFWGMVLKLIYSGNPRYGWKLLAEAWPANGQNKKVLEVDFCSILKSSPYYADLDTPMEGAPPICIQAKPGTAR
jgi:hypothetical protein